eukprot:TRINITY_DN12326_c0_g1_i4.p1 TRINITY_DN12326_c0_g1~~TRINITY_DN12326_c0_g1_i4.p1  ORF type:complete len:896 (-),score=101.71 TRINITY_DN12326_c0_g1_i4:389-3076(-)
MSDSGNHGSGDDKGYNKRKLGGVDEANKPKIMRHTYNTTQSNNWNSQHPNMQGNQNVGSTNQAIANPPQVQNWQYPQQQWNTLESQTQQQQQVYSQQQVADPYTAAYWAAYGAAYAQFTAMWQQSYGMMQPQQQHGLPVPHQFPHPPSSQCQPQQYNLPPAPPPTHPSTTNISNHYNSNAYGGHVGTRDGRMSTSYQGNKKRDSLSQQRGKALNKQIIQTRGDPVQIFKMLYDNWQDVDEVNIATSFYQIGKAEHGKEMQQWIQQNPMFVRIVQFAEQNAAQFSARNISNIIWSFAKMENVNFPTLIASLSQEIEKKLQDFNPQNLANVLWAFGTMGYIPVQRSTDVPHLLDTMAARAKAIIRDFSPQNVSNTVLAYAKLNYVTDGVKDLMNYIGEKCVDKVVEFNPQALSNTAWGYSKLEIWPEEFMKTILEQSTAKLPQFVAQNISNIMWAWANMGKNPGNEFLEAVAGELPRVAKDMTGQNLCNVIWGCAKLGYRNQVIESLVQLYALKIVKQSDCPPQTVANLIWGFATLGRHPGTELVTAVQEHFLQQLKSYSPQQMANTLWAFATLTILEENLMKTVAGSYNENAMNMIGDYGQQNIEVFSAQHLSMTVHAFGKLTHFHQGLLDAAVERVVRIYQQLTVPQICNVFYTFAILNYRHQECMDVLVAEVVRRDAEGITYTGQQCCNILWALAILDRLTINEWYMFKKHLLKEDKENLLDSSYTQIYLAYLVLRMSQDEECSKYPDEMQAAALEKFSQDLKEVHISKLHQEVSKCLNELGVAHRNECMVEEGLFSIDIIIEEDCLLGHKKVAIEVDGPGHFTANTNQELGTTLVRRSILKQFGWTVLSIPFFKWRSLQCQDRKEYLSQLVQPYTNIVQGSYTAEDTTNEVNP